MNSYLEELKEKVIEQDHMLQEERALRITAERRLIQHIQSSATHSKNNNNDSTDRKKDMDNNSKMNGEWSWEEVEVNTVVGKQVFRVKKSYTTID